jgi:hypothetical protein
MSHTKEYSSPISCFRPLPCISVLEKSTYKSEIQMIQSNDTEYENKLYDLASFYHDEKLYKDSNWPIS